MKKIRCFVYLIVIATLSLSFALFAGCTNEVETPEVKKYLMNVSRVTLERCESTKLSVLDVEGDFVWSSTEEGIATVDENGLVTAVGAGSSVIKASNERGEAKCIITVTDNNLLPRIESNLDGENLYLIKGENFNLDYSVTYNGKPITAETEVIIEGEEGIISYQDGEIISKDYGEVKVIISAKWSGKESIKVIDVGVVPNLVARIYDKSNETIYNDSRAGATSILLVPELLEDGEPLAESDYELVGSEYNKDVIAFDQESNEVSFLTKGKTTLELYYKSKVTGNSVSSSLLINTELFNEDKSSEIMLKDAYVSNGTYELSVEEVFNDIEELEDCSIKEIRDVSNGSLLLNYADGKMDISTFSSLGLLGQRKWYVECEKYAYTVSVNVEKRNYAQPLYGTYDFVNNYYTNPNWEYKLVLEEEAGIKSFKFVNKETNQVGCKGYIELSTWMEERDGGSMRLFVTEKTASVFTQAYMDGYYYFNNGTAYVNLIIYSAFNGYNILPINYYSVSSAPYKGVAGEYKTVNWETCSFNLAEDGTAILTVNGTSYNGKYVLTPTNPYDGEIVITLDEAYRNQTTFASNYVLKNGIYVFETITFEFNQRTFIYEQDAEKKPLLDKFEGYYRADKEWPIRFLLNRDGTVIFNDQLTYKDSISKDGVYELIPKDANSGTIKFTFYKPYSNVYTYEGTYNLVDGKYVFQMEIAGTKDSTGSILRTFTLAFAR